VKPACVKFSRSAHGTVGCTVGIAPNLYVGAYGDSAAEALSKAGEIAAQVQSRIDEDPELAAVLSAVPGGAAAFRAIAAASALYHSGADAHEVMRHLGPTAAKVVKSILRMF
jgi:hypothetical protein